MPYRPSRRSPRLAWALIVLVLNAVLLLSGCDFLETRKQATPTYIVESYQIAGEPLGHVRLMETRSTEVKYDPQEAGVENATVSLALLADSTSAVLQHHPFEAHPNRPGIYVPADPQAIVRPLGTYRLRIAIPGADSLITATTTVPDTFSLASSNPDTVTYGGTDPFGIRVTESRYPGREAIYFLNTTVERPLTEERLTPAGKDLVDGTESLAGGSSYTLGSLAGNEWPMRSAEQYPRLEDGTLTITYPWENFVYYGPTTVHIHTVDENLHRFWQGDKAQAGGAPGVIPNVRDDIAGGAGLFTGLARQRYEVYVAR